MRTFNRIMRSAMPLALLLLAACGGNETSAPAAVTTTSYSAGGTVSGLIGTVVLQDNGGDNLSLTANGNFTFATKILNGNTYNVTVLTQPAGQTCSVSTGVGTVSGGNVTNVAVVCSMNAYSVGGNVSGLTGSMVLQNNNGDNLSVNANGAITFATMVAFGSPYSVTVLTQPTGQTCSVSTGAGTVSGGDVTNVAVVCSMNAYSVGGNVSGLTGSVVLQNNNGDNLSVNANGAITFATMVAFGSPYSVTVLTQPVGQSCSLASNTGTMGTAAVTNVAITCVTNTYTIGGTVSGLNGSMVLQNNNGDNLTVAVNGAFNFATAVAYGNPYSVSVLSKPASQHCTVTSGAGTIATSNISNVGVACVNNQMGGAMQLGAALNLSKTVSTFAGGATFTRPTGITTDGTNLYVVAPDNHIIRQVVIATGAITTLAGQTGVVGAVDGAGTAATFNWPSDITTDGTNLYVTDDHNNKIRQIVIATGVVSSLTGTPNTAMGVGAADGAGTDASFNRPSGITTDGTNLYVADSTNNKIRQIVIATGVVSSLTGTANTTMGAGAADGAGTDATFNWPSGITTDGTNLYVTDSQNNKIRQIVISSGVVSSLTGTANTAMGAGAADGAGTDATFDWPYGITTDGTNLYVVDSNNNKIRQIVIATGAVTTLAGTGAYGALDGAGTDATFREPSCITTDGSSLYVGDTTSNLIRKIQ
jgi:sugar lactone lactonase YvrE